jgi:hypothetical protein
MRKVQFLIVHHSVSMWGDGNTIKDWHCKPKPKGNGWKYPGYHDVVCNGFPTYNSYSKGIIVPSAKGRVDRILSEDIPSNGVKFGNSNSLNVCLIGDFDKQKLPDFMEVKLIDLLEYWCKTRKLDPMFAVRGHGERQIEIGREGYHKTCPGKNINMRAIRLKVAERL